MKQHSIRYEHTKQHNPLTNARFCNIFWQSKADNKGKQQQNKRKTRKRDKHREQKQFSFDCYISFLEPPGVNGTPKTIVN